MLLASQSECSIGQQVNQRHKNVNFSGITEIILKINPPVLTTIRKQNKTIKKNLQQQQQKTQHLNKHASQFARVGKGKCWKS